MYLNRQIIAIICFLLMTATYALGHVTDRNLQNFQYNAELASVAPIVDGFLDDPVWETAIPGKLEQDLITSKHWAESSDFTGSFAAVWRNGFLYIAIKLIDDQLETDQTKLLLEDHLVIYLDPHHSGRKDDHYRFEIPIRKMPKILNYPLTRVEWGNNGQTCELSFQVGDIAEKRQYCGILDRL